MKIKKNWNLWKNLAKVILSNRFLILLTIISITFCFSTQWQHIKFTFTEANLLPDNHPDNIEYENFKKQFGEEGNLLLISVKDSSIFSEKKFNSWNLFSQKLLDLEEIKSLLSTSNLKVLKKNDEKKKFEFISIIPNSNLSNEQILQFKEKLIYNLPFYKNLIYSESGKAIRTIAYMDSKIVNTKARKTFITDKFIPLIRSFESENNIDLKVSGMPYVRTLNAQNIIDEIGLFVLSAMFITSLIFFLFFRSVRATLISLLVVSIGVMWSFGTLGLLNYEITVLTALIPPLIIVIGIPNCIFFINKYQQEVLKTEDKYKSLETMITKIGYATLITNLTTAFGFATFILTNSKVLREFGIVASINIIGLFLISLLLIPIIYSFLKISNSKHIKQLENKNINKFIDWMENNVKHNRNNIYIISMFFFTISILGINKMKISASLIEDMPKQSNFFKDIQYYDEEFSGVVPIEILINTNRKNGMRSLSTLKKINKLHEEILNYSELSSPLSILNVYKYSKQAYYNGNPDYFKLPTSQENRFISQYLMNSSENSNLFKNYIDNTMQYGRITTFMKDIKTDRIEKIKNELRVNINKIFPPNKFNVILTGKSLLFIKGTKYLIKNLFLSLSLAILLISFFMALMFRSFKMIVISLIPNLLPLILTAGLMGFFSIPLKASTILVFSIAFGISVDFTIHFLAKYRLESIRNKKLTSIVYQALRETGLSMFYSGIVLFFGFAIFMISNFGGTVALGGLVSATLLFSMLSNLLLLPSLLISFNKT